MYDRIAPEQHDSLDGIPEPSETVRVFGHDGVETQLWDALRGGKLLHALIFAGPRGIGKASMAFQLAERLLADPESPDPPGRSAARDTASSLYRQVAGGAHPSVLHLTRPYNDRTKSFRTALTVDEVRRVGAFLSLTAHDGGYRFVIVDPADDMNTNAANALLKSLEEPPRRTLFILISHSIGRLLPTIRSRCQILRFQPLNDEAMLAALAALGRLPPEDEQASFLVRAVGSVGSAIMLTDYGGQEIADAVDRLVGGASSNVAEMHKVAEAVAGRDRAIQFGIFSDHALEVLAGAANHAARQGNLERAWRLSDAWERSRDAIRETEAYNLDRKQHVLSMIFRLNSVLRM